MFFGVTHLGAAKPITLSGRYKAAWQIYSNPSGIPGGEFRYLVWHVK